jgi:hypothetical protein
MSSKKTKKLEQYSDSFGAILIHHGGFKSSLICFLAVLFNICLNSSQL